jgi:hypothetical protein
MEQLLSEEGRLAARRDELRARERALDDREAAVLGQERDHKRETAQRQAMLRQQADELGARAAELAAREAELEERLRVLDETVRKRARSLANETVSLTERAAELSRRALALGVTPGNEDTLAGTPAPPPNRVATPAGGWNLNRIERLVDEHSLDRPDRLPEWRYYLVYLREHADVHGKLPPTFDWLVWEAFGELLSAEEPGPG